LRSVTPQLWTSLPEPERARFLRHVRPFWEVVRHRSAPSVDGQIQELMLSGKLHIHSARIAAATLSDGTASGGVEVRIEPRGGAIARTLRVARVINCTGPDTDCRRIHSPLITQLREDGLAIECPLGQGLLTDDGARLIGRAGAVWENAWLIGPMAKGSAWEITAVPELREHAARIAEVLAAEPIASRERQT